MTCGVYQIRNKLDNKLYIGSSNNIEGRWKSHAYKSTNKHLRAAIKKYGINNFEFSILMTCDPDSLLDNEQHYMDKYSPKYNASKIAGKVGKLSKKIWNKISALQRARMTGSKLPEETKAKISASLKGVKKSKETREKMSQAMLGNNHGSVKPHRVSEETKAKISAAHKGKKYGPYTAERKANISAGLKGNTNNKNRKYHLLSQETRDKISESLRKYNLLRREEV